MQIRLLASLCCLVLALCYQVTARTAVPTWGNAERQIHVFSTVSLQTRAGQGSGDID